VTKPTDSKLADQLHELVRRDHRLKNVDVAYQPALLKLHIGGPGGWIHTIDTKKLSANLAEYAQQIVDEWEGRPTRGVIILASGIEKVPAYILDHVNTFWPPGMPEKKPGEPVHFVNPSDMYKRVRLIEENIYVFVPERLILMRSSKNIEPESASG
jgi:hypothetical protein